MNYLIITTLKKWLEYNMRKIERYEKAVFEISGKQINDIINTQPNDKLLILIKDNDKILTYEAFIINTHRNNSNSSLILDFIINKVFNSIDIYYIKNGKVFSEYILTENKRCRWNFIGELDSDKYKNIINELIEYSSKYYGMEESRSFFDKAVNTLLTYNPNIINKSSINSNNCSNNTIKVKKLKKMDFNFSNFSDKNYICKIKDIIDKYKPVQLYELIEIEAIAYYKSYHNSYNKYGIYFNLMMFANYIISTYNTLSKTNYNDLSFKEIRDLCLVEILQHERFHYLTELFITFEELASRRSTLYSDYKDTYKNTFLTDDCMAEALANYFVKMYFIFNDKKDYIDILNIMFKQQAPGYRVAASIDSDNEMDMFIKFEEQLELYSYRGSNPQNKMSVLYKDISEIYLKNILPLAQIEINKELNIPIYIVNDDMKANDFYALLDIIFPLL